MAKLTRSEIVSRALIAYDKAGYWFGGDYLTKSGTVRHVKYVGYDANGKGLGYNCYGEAYPVIPCPASESPYIACDCAAFTGWCWGVDSGEVWSGDFHTGRFASNYRKGFAGIQIGDVLHKDGHVALYCGSYILELATGSWFETGSKWAQYRNNHGGRRCPVERMYDFTGYCSYDSTYSTDYDPDEEEPEYFVNDGSAYEGNNPNNPNKMDFSPNGVSDTIYVLNHQYTRRYSLMKHYRSM